MAFVNLTPHAINIAGGVSILPSGTVARCASVSSEAGTHEGVSLVHADFGAVEGLPGPVAGTIYIVSALVRAASPSRGDVASPGDLLRTPEGVVTGCRNLVVNRVAL